MEIDVLVQVMIHRPRPEVGSFMFDPRNEKIWTTGVVESHPLSSGPLQVGSRVERKSRFLGREFRYTYEVVAADDYRFVELHVTQPFPMQIRYELEDAPGGTNTRIRARGDATGFFLVAAPLLNVMVRKNITNDLEKLKNHLENQARA